MTIEADSKGRMSVPALIKAIEKTLLEGGTPFLVGATAGIFQKYLESLP